MKDVQLHEYTPKQFLNPFPKPLELKVISLRNHMERICEKRKQDWVAYVTAILSSGYG